MIKDNHKDSTKYEKINQNNKKKKQKYFKQKNNFYLS